jgi:hypothetical protein
MNKILNLKKYKKIWAFSICYKSKKRKRKNSTTRSREILQTRPTRLAHTHTGGVRRGAAPSVDLIGIGFAGNPIYRALAGAILVPLTRVAHGPRPINGGFTVFWFFRGFFWFSSVFFVSGFSFVFRVYLFGYFRAFFKINLFKIWTIFEFE